MSNKKVHKPERQDLPDLPEGDHYYIPTVKLRLNKGKMEVDPTTEGLPIIMGTEDEAQGINIRNLIRNGGIVPYEDEEQLQRIREHYVTVTRPNRQALRTQVLRDKRRMA